MTRLEGVVDAIDEVERGRASYAARAWADAHRSLSHANARAPLDADDL